MTGAATRVRDNGQDAVPEAFRGKTRSRSLPARHGGQAAGRPRPVRAFFHVALLTQLGPATGFPSCLRAGGMTDIARPSLIGNDMHSPKT